MLKLHLENKRLYFFFVCRIVVSAERNGDFFSQLFQHYLFSYEQFNYSVAFSTLAFEFESGGGRMVRIGMKCLVYRLVRKV